MARLAAGRRLLLLQHTRAGRAIRAVGQNQDAAQLLGMNVSALYMSAFGLSAVLASVAGILLGSIRFLSPGMGGEPLTKALIVMIFGGLGSMLGTVIGAYVIGLLEATSNYVVGLYWTPAILFGVMIVTLMIRPSGLFGKLVMRATLPGRRGTRIALLIFSRPAKLAVC